MADIVIRRCSLRVTRHGGWSWGSDRRGLVERVTRLFPELIAARLAELLGEEEIEIVEPLRLRVALGRASFDSPERLKAAIDSAISPEGLPAILAASAAQSPAQGREASSPYSASEAASPASAGVAPPLSLRELLLRWRARGELPRRLAGFSEAAAALWLAALLDEIRLSTAEPPLRIKIADELRAIRRRLPPETRGPAQAERSRLLAAVELTARHARLPAGHSVRRALDQVLPSAPAPPETVLPASAKDKAAAESRAAPAGGGATKAIIGTREPAPARRADGVGRARREVALASVLPFLALGMLARIGWLEAAMATFRSLRLPDGGAPFAAALAGKLLPPPERGWHRPGRALDTVAVFAGLDSAPSPIALETWSRSAGGDLSPLGAFVAFEIANGHGATLPLLVTRTAETPGAPWLLFDSDGFYPVAFAHDEAALLEAVRPFRASILLVAARAATPRLMRDLAAGGFAFATDAPPARGEGWPKLAGKSGCWASPGEIPLPRLAAAAIRLAELEELAAATCRELLTLRPAVAPGKAAALDEAAALAAAMGLGLLAWSLWHDREPVDPLLALLRLGDLDGSARLTPEALEVRPAVGRRYLDLKAHGLLADIAGVPWLGGRIVRFVGP